MTSLRARLILAFSLLAVIPIAVAVIFLTGRIESMVRTEAKERLGSALGTMQAQVAEDARDVAGKLEILARDAQLKRLFFLSPVGGRDLAEFLAERQLLLGLDFLSAADSSGGMIASGPGMIAGSGLAALPWNVAAVGTVPGVQGLALIARSPIRYQGLAVGTIQGGLRLDAALLRKLGSAAAVDLILRDGAGKVAASTLSDSSAGNLSRTIPLEVGPPPHATITGVISTAAADRTVASIQLASLLLGLLGLAIAIPLAILWSSQISGPVERLAAFSDRLASGNWQEPLTLESVGELQTLVLALDRMRRDLQTYRDKLVTSERQAAWSQMARKVAHEVKNPLTPIAISIADLKRSYDQKRPDFPEILDQAVRIIGEEVETLRHLLQEFSDFGRIPAPVLAPCKLSDLLGDLEALYAGDISAGRLIVTRPPTEITFPADSGQIRQSLINLIQNGLEALDGTGRVTVSAQADQDAVEIAVADSGPGLTEEQRANLFVPGFTTKSHGSGLGLTIVQRIVSDHQGLIAVDAGRSGGTTFRVRLPLRRSEPT
jgi:nitrogen fixation/metabolism regulation signal transduction histidine kinase